MPTIAPSTLATTMWVDGDASTSSMRPLVSGGAELDTCGSKRASAAVVASSNDLRVVV